MYYNLLKLYLNNGRKNTLNAFLGEALTYLLVEFSGSSKSDLIESVITGANLLYTVDRLATSLINLVKWLLLKLNDSKSYASPNNSMNSWTYLTNYLQVELDAATFFSMYAISALLHFYANTSTMSFLLALHLSVVYILSNYYLTSSKLYSAIYLIIYSYKLI